MEKPADTRHPVLEVIKRRWSPRAFSDRLVEHHKIKRMLEAARWAASSFNEQPWRFIVATRDHPEQFDKVLRCLAPGNQAWAGNAPLLGLTLSKKTFTNGGKPNRVHVHDIGLAMGNLTLQAMAMDLFVHQMAGVELDKVVAEFAVPDDFEPVAGFAIGYAGDPSQLPEQWMRDAEREPRTRKPLAELVFGEEFDKPSPLVQSDT